jgi:hypothetical protein
MDSPCAPREAVDASRSAARIRGSDQGRRACHWERDCRAAAQPFSPPRSATAAGKAMAAADLPPPSVCRRAYWRPPLLCAVPVPWLATSTDEIGSHQFDESALSLAKQSLTPAGTGRGGNGPTARPNRGSAKVKAPPVTPQRRRRVIRINQSVVPVRSPAMTPAGGACVHRA